MQVELGELLQSILQNLSRFNQELQLDQKNYSNHQYDAVEQSNINKLMLKNELDKKIEQLGNYPDWSNQKEIHGQVWKSIQEEIAASSNLMAINSEFVKKNLTLFDNLLKRIIQIKPQESSVYNNLAQVE